MGEYPRRPAELEDLLGSDEACRTYLERLRWPDGFRCPGCGESRAWLTGRGLWFCRGCGRQTSVTAGTIFQGRHFPLRTWFRAIWWVCSQKTGVSALGLKRVLGLGSYQTAWTWLHKLRRAMVRPGRDKLSGTVEVDETFWGGPRKGKRGRGARGKAILLVGAQAKGPNVGRIRLARVREVTSASAETFVQSAIEPGSTIRTDGYKVYRGLERLGYKHRYTVTAEAAHESQRLPRAHLVASLLKRWLLGTHQGAVRARQLDYYLDEFTFRFNRRTSRSRGLLFHRLLQNAVQLPPTPYRLIVAKPRARRPRRVGVT